MNRWIRVAVTVLVAVVAGPGCGSDVVGKAAHGGPGEQRSVASPPTAAAPVLTVGNAATPVEGAARETVSTVARPTGTDPVSATARPTEATAPKQAQGARPQGAAGGSASAPSVKSSSAGSPAPAPAPAPGGSAPAPPAGPAAPVRLGSIVTGSGPIGAAIRSIPETAKAWTADVNARGGLNGHPVQVIVGDDRGDPAQALALAKRMVADDKVIAFWFMGGPTTLQAVAPYLEQEHIPAMESCSCNSVTDVSPMIFQTGVNSDEGNAFAHVLGLTTFTDKHKVALLYCREVNACEKSANAIEAVAKQGRLNVQVVAKAQVSLAQPDYTAEVVAARNAGAEALIITTDYASVIRIARSAHRQGYNPAMSTQWNSNDVAVIQNGGKDVEGLTMGALTPEASSSPKLADYRAALSRFVPGGTLNGFGANTWVGGKLLEKIAARFPAGGAVSTNDILEGLYSLRNETLGGLLPGIAYKRNQPHAGTNHCVVPVQIQNGHFVTKGDQFVCDPAWKPVEP